jgi:dodecin
MTDGSVYKRVVLVGTSPNSCEEAVQNAVAIASQTVWNLRIAEGKVVEYRAKVKISFKIERGQMF